jgi:prepilin-type N-terminal cleavage/methylation domain-containing protein
MNSLNKRFQKGFTIVELLIVIVVIGILAALVITTYNGIQQKGRNTERTTDLKAVQGQLEAYYAQNGRYPSTTDIGTTSANNVTFIQARVSTRKLCVILRVPAVTIRLAPAPRVLLANTSTSRLMIQATLATTAPRIVLSTL